MKELNEYKNSSPFISRNAMIFYKNLHFVECVVVTLIHSTVELANMHLFLFLTMLFTYLSGQNLRRCTISRCLSS